jgi:hypothetical protein
VPAAYAPLFTTVTAQMNTFTTLAAAVPTPSGPVPQLVYGTSLMAINGQDLQPSVTIAMVNTELDRLKYLGLGGVTFSIPYPDFLPWYSQSASLLNFYKKVVASIRARGMQVVIERGDSPNGSFSFPDFCTYESEQAQIDRAILAQLAPDLLWVVDEPSTRKGATGYVTFDSPISTTQYAAFEVGAASDPNCPSNIPVPMTKGLTKIAAGQGAWEQLDFAQGYATIDAIDVLDVHAFPIINTLGNPFMQRIIDIGNLAKESGKGFSLTEEWLNKQTKDELAMDYPTLIGRDVFSFWAPLDQVFIDDLVRIAQRQGALYISPYWGGFFETYLTYQPGVADETFTALQLRQKLVDLQYPNRNNRGPFSSTGVAYCRLIAAATGSACVALTPQPSATPTATPTPHP